MKSVKILVLATLLICDFSYPSNGLTIYSSSLKDQAPNELIIGYWRMTQDPTTTICISKDTLTYFYNNKISDGYGFKLLDSVFFQERMVKPRKTEKLFVLFDQAEVFEVHFLLGIEKSEFSLMALSSGQTAVYKRIKNKVRCPN